MTKEEAAGLVLTRIDDLGSLSKVAKFYKVNKGQLHSLIHNPDYKPRLKFRRKLGIAGRVRFPVWCRDEQEMIELRKIRDERRLK